MFKTLKIAAIACSALVLGSGMAHATQIGAGTLGVTYLGAPTVNTVNDTVQLGLGNFYFNGTGSFAGFTGTGTTSNTLFSFSPTNGNIVSYTGTPINGLITFSGGGDTYSFDLDTSVKTT